ncbi:response regulator transcription factor [Natrinema halophilum]|uniref:Response regulator n=1 Tax=Natrinema halophilum TaxID=1699371 RepID=A0A7D5KZS8_9EURY|nr:response regulator [Natrinema halophilum]QLG50040.1 response regulator [Natrinema halophilum]
MTDQRPDQRKPVILIAEDERSVAEGYELWLADQYEVRLVSDGQEALDAIDETVDVALLDRMMPQVSGRQVLREIREREMDCRVAMVTAVEPDFDVIEMGFDAYVTKPPERQELIETIEQLLDRASVDDALQEYHSLMARKGTLQTQKTELELAESEEYQELLDRIEMKREEVDEDLGDMDSEIDFVSAVREVDASDGDLETTELDGVDAFETEEEETDE